MITFTGLLFFLLPRGKTIRTSLWQMNFNFPISIIMPSLTGEGAHPKSTHTHKQSHPLFLSRTRSCKEEEAAEENKKKSSQDHKKHKNLWKGSGSLLSLLFTPPPPRPNTSEREREGEKDAAKKERPGEAHL